MQNSFQKSALPVGKRLCELAHLLCVAPPWPVLCYRAYCLVTQPAVGLSLPSSLASSLPGLFALLTVPPPNPPGRKGKRDQLYTIHMTQLGRGCPKECGVCIPEKGRMLDLQNETRGPLSGPSEFPLPPAHVSLIRRLHRSGGGSMKL